LPAYAAGIEQQCKPQIIVEWYWSASMGLYRLQISPLAIRR
jgi:hypothetical protein